MTVLTHALWSLVPGIMIVVAVVLALLEFLGLGKNADLRGNAVRRNGPQVMCIFMIGSCAASAPLIKSLLDLESPNVFRVAGDMIHNFACVYLTCKVIAQRSVAGLSFHTVTLYALVFSTRYIDLVTMWSFDLPEGTNIWDFVSVYNTVLKLLYLTTSYTLILMFFCFKDTYDAEADQFCKTLVVVPALMLATKVNYSDNWDEVLWTFSIYLEVVAMVPQLLMFRAMPCACCYNMLRGSPSGGPCAVITNRLAPCCRSLPGAGSCLPPPRAPPALGQAATAAGPLTVDPLLWFYVLCMAMYRAFYLLNWIYRYENFTPPVEEPGAVYWDPLVWVSGTCQTSLFLPFFYHYVKRFVLVYSNGAAGEAYALIRTYDPDEEGSDVEASTVMAPGAPETPESGDGGSGQLLQMVELERDGGGELDDEWAAAARAAP